MTHPVPANLALTIPGGTTPMPISVAGGGFCSGYAEDGKQIFGKNGRSESSKFRVPGGSGCDAPGDIYEHPECNAQKGRHSPQRWPFKAARKHLAWVTGN